jgi:hypothetical protein
VNADRKRVDARRRERLFGEPRLSEPSPDRWSQIRRVAMARSDHSAALAAKRRHGPNRRLDVAVGDVAEDAAARRSKKLNQRSLPRHRDEARALEHHLVDRGGEVLVVAWDSWRVGEPPRGEAVATDAEVAKAFESILADGVER